jgi:hypothetical protein
METTDTQKTLGTLLRLARFSERERKILETSFLDSSDTDEVMILIAPSDWSDYFGVSMDVAETMLDGASEQLADRLILLPGGERVPVLESWANHAEEGVFLYFFNPVLVRVLQAATQFE